MAVASCRDFVARLRNGFVCYSRAGITCEKTAAKPDPVFLASFTREASCSASITRLNKPVYPRLYKARLVQPDGSTYVVRYSEPRKLVFVPIDPNTLTEEEKKARLKRLKPEKPKKIYLMEGDDEQFNQRSWSNLVRKR